MKSELGNQLRNHVEYLASPELSGRKPGTDGNRKAAQYIEQQYRALGLTPLSSLGGFRQVVTPRLGDNLIGVREPVAPLHEAPWIVIAAHYDHLGGNFLGADDNAAAVAILFELARTLPTLRHHHILYVAFNMEEPPYIRTPLMGSQHFVDHLPEEIGSPSQFKTVIIMDLIGGVHWEPIQDVIFAAGAEKSPELYQRLKEAGNESLITPPSIFPSAHLSNPIIKSEIAQSRNSPSDDPSAHITTSEITQSRNSSLSVLPMGMHLVEEIPLLGQVSFSDYDAFRNAKVPFVFLSAGRTPRYHQATDLPNTLHYERMAATVSWLHHLLLLIDRDTTPYSFSPDRLEFADEVASLRPLVAQAVNPDTSIPNTSALSFWRLRHDHEWLQHLDVNEPTPESLSRLEHISIRMQCLLGDFSGCFLF